MKTTIFLTATALIGLTAPSQAADTTLEQMPAQLETRYALSALPPALRAKASVYLLDPKKGYALSRHGTSGIECLVERTAWEHADFRSDIYIPLCYDAAGLKGHFKAIVDSAALCAQGLGPDALKAEIREALGERNLSGAAKAGTLLHGLAGDAHQRPAGPQSPHHGDAASDVQRIRPHQ